MTNGWQEVPLKEVAKQTSRSVFVEAGTTYRTIGVKWWGMGAYERESIDGSRTAAKTLSIVREGDLIINKIWVRHGSVAIAGKDVDGCAGSGEFPTFELDLNRIDPRWIHWQTKMKSFWEKCDDLSRGTSGKNRIKPELFLTINIPLPPLTEQRRIVAHIESLAARVNEAQRLRENAEKETNAILHSAQNQFIGSEPKPDWVALRHYVSEIKNGKSPDCEKRPAKLDEWGVLKVGAVSFGVFDEQQNKALPLSIEPNPEYEVKAGYFLMIRANTKELVGACAIVEKTRPRLLISDKTFRFIFREDNVIDMRYLNHVLKSPALRIQIEAQATGTSPTMKNISKEKVMELKVPSIPLDEQRRIVAYLDGLQAKVSTLSEMQSASGEELSALMPSILDKAFKGEL